MSGYSIALVWIALAAQVIAWPTARLHEPGGDLMRLPPNDRAIAERLIRGQLGPMAQGEDAGQMNKTILSFRAERLNLGGTPALAVQASGTDYCGAPGNCAFWVVDLLRRRILLHADGIQRFGLDGGAKNSAPDVITYTHESALEGELIRWKFSGASYEPGVCATAVSGDAEGNSLPQPKITPHPCSTEGN